MLRTNWPTDRPTEKNFPGWFQHETPRCSDCGVRWENLAFTLAHIRLGLLLLPLTHLLHVSLSHCRATHCAPRPVEWFNDAGDAITLIGHGFDFCPDSAIRINLGHWIIHARNLQSRVYNGSKSKTATIGLSLGKAYTRGKNYSHVSSLAVNGNRITENRSLQSLLRIFGSGLWSR